MLSLISASPRKPGSYSLLRHPFHMPCPSIQHKPLGTSWYKLQYSLCLSSSSRFSVSSRYLAPSLTVTSYKVTPTNTHLASHFLLSTPQPQSQHNAAPHFTAVPYCKPQYLLVLSLYQQNLTVPVPCPYFPPAVTYKSCSLPPLQKLFISCTNQNIARSFATAPIGRSLDWGRGGRLWASAGTQTRSALFFNITQRIVGISYRRFGAPYRSHIQGQEIQEHILTLEDGNKNCLYASVRNYRYKRRNIPENRRSIDAASLL
jgi:hypothetical protein